MFELTNLRGDLLLDRQQGQGRLVPAALQALDLGQEVVAVALAPAVNKELATALEKKSTEDGHLCTFLLSLQYLNGVVVVSEDLVVAAPAVLGQRARVHVVGRHPGGDGPADPEVLDGAGARGEEALVLLGAGRALAGLGVALPAEGVVEDDVEGGGAGAARAVGEGDLGEEPKGAEGVSAGITQHFCSALSNKMIFKWLKLY